MFACIRCGKGKNIVKFSRHKKGSSGAGGVWALRAPIHKRTQKPNLHRFQGQRYCTKCLRIVKVSVRLQKPVEQPQEGSVLVLILLAIVLIGLSVFGTYYAIGNKLIVLPGIGESAKITQALPTPQPKESKLQGVLALKEGSVALQKIPGVWEEIAQGGTLKEGDVIRTGYKARAVIELDDGSAVRLDQGTQVSFTNLSGQVILLTQDDGRVYHRVYPGRLVYNVKSLDTVTTALGTSFSVKTNQKQQVTEVSVYESKVAVTSGGPENTKTQVDSGEMAIVDKNEKPALSKITEADKKEAFIAWNQTLDKEPVPATPAPTVTPKPVVQESSKKETANVAAVPTVKLSLKAISLETGKVYMVWMLKGSEANGFKLVSAEHQDPAYPEDNWEDASAETRSFYFTKNLISGKTYHFRVGLYGPDGKVSIYSNDVTVTVK